MSPAAMSGSTPMAAERCRSTATEQCHRVRSGSDFESVANDLGKRLDEFRASVERDRARDPYSFLPCERLSLDVEVIQNLEMIRDKTDWAHEDVACAGALDRLEEVRTEPRLASAARRLERALPVRQPHFAGHQPAALHQLVVIAVTLGDDSRGKAVRGEEHPLGHRFGERFRQQVAHSAYEGRVRMEAGDEDELAIPCLGQRALVAAKAHPRVVRS